MINTNARFNEETNSTIISMTGGTGFIGKHLINAFSKYPDLELRVLARSKEESHSLKVNNVRIYCGDLENPNTLREFLAPGNTLIHLAYPNDWNISRHLTAAKELGRIAAEVGVRRIILCSTAVVVGNARSSRVNEDTKCSPANNYERTKLNIEHTFATYGKDAYQLAVLRPTAVIGEGSRNLVNLARALTHGSRIVNYLRSSLFGKRHMNLVCVENVVAALDFLARRKQKISTEIFIVSDDDDPMNNYRDVEAELMLQLGVANYPVPPFSIPRQVLSGVLYLGGRSCIDPMRIYDGSRIVRAGLKKISTISQSIERFAAFFKDTEKNMHINKHI